VENKQIVVNIARQTLSCYQDDREVYFCRVSTGRYGEGTETPIGDYLRIYMKFFSTHMEGGASGAGYDLSGIGWSTFIATGGIAIHTCYWHNNFGERMSAGCVNASPEDAKFVFRWSSPVVPYYPGKLDTVPGTGVRVVAS
jgi:lipoprotein-anchoring transpeptidase ErfK/SrfK